LLSGHFYELWIGEKLQIPFTLSVFMSLFAIMSTWNNIFVFFLNGTGKIKLQIYYSLMGMIINIPISVFLAKNMGLGSSGVILGTCISLLFGAVLAPIQYYKIINKKAFGIWNK
jgi:Na+-driven multidrug efflux pump